MGSKAPSDTTTTSRVQLPAWLDQTLQSNVQTGNMLTSGVIPNFGQSSGAGGSAPPGIANGMRYGSTPVDIPGVGSINIPSAGTYTNADGSEYKPPASFISDYNPYQMDALNHLRIAGQNTPGATDLGADIYKGIAGFQAPTMQAASMSAADPLKARMMTDMNLEGYYTPFKEQVMNPVLADLTASEDRQRAMQRQSARAAGTLRGSGFGVDNAILEGELSRARGATTGGLLNTMYGQATGLAQNDLGRELTAGMSNQQVQQQANMTNAQLAQQAGLSNLDAAMRAPVIQGLGAQGLASANMGAWQNAMTGGNTLWGMGSTLQNLDQRRLTEPMDLLGWRNGIATGASPYLGGSQTTGPSPYGSSGGLAGALGGAAGGAGLYGALTAGASPLLAASGPLGWGMMGLGALAGAF